MSMMALAVARKGLPRMIECSSSSSTSTIIKSARNS
ncbi:hypothetical protein A2U01_0061122, partial [Trifolium medium]|nr:hypothetical protein [Trifolium medium]